MKKICFIIIFIIVFSLFKLVNAKDNNVLNNKIIVIDPGHGGLDPGTVYGELYEKDINLSISLLLKKELEKNKVKVIMTREGDYDLSSPGAMYRKKSDFDNRIKIINNSNADLYLSIHLNYLDDKKYYGPQVFYLDDDKLASIMQKGLNNIVGSSRKIKLIPSSTYMYKRLAIHGLLIECGFLSNNDERVRLQSKEYQNKLVKAIVDSLKLYFTQNS